MIEKPQSDRDEKVVKLLGYLFHGPYVEEMKIPQGKKGFVLPAHFCGWLDSRMRLMDGSDVSEKAGVERDVWDFAVEMLASGLAPERIYQVWYNIALGDRPVPRHNLEKINLVMLLTWDDGTIMPVQVFVTREMLEDGKKFTDGLVASIMSKNSVIMPNAVAEDGLDGLHDKGTNYRGTTAEDPFDVFMGLLVKFIPQLRPEFQKPVTDYKLLAQGIIRPLLPPEVRAQLEARKRRWQSGGRPVGGWDAG